MKLIADGIGGVRRLLAAATLGEHVASVHSLLQYARALDYAELPDYALLIPVIFITMQHIRNVCYVCTDDRRCTEGRWRSEQFEACEAAE